ncbi:uncharacterized protein LOC127122917 [Lathyrus oleraceus]|uniref:uncharacterized protein LOC127122917 n=1 Tax=Pisum sativum TaxID=3888 RepID=UPI0021CE123D|nr:uncharacterized protein LOC127122917 [Pisum sativum]
MSQHQDTSPSKNTKCTPKVSVPPMGIPDDEILDVAPLLFPTRTFILTNPSPLMPPLLHVPIKEGTHYTDRVIRDLVTRILNEGLSVKGVSTPLAQMYPSLEVEQHSGKGDDSSNSEKDLAAEGLCSLGKNVSKKGKFVASNTTNASHSEKHDNANVVIDLEDGSSDDQEESLIHHIKPSVAKRMKTRKGKSVVELIKVGIKKRKVRDDFKPEEDVKEDVPDISPAKKTTVRKSPVEVPVVHLDNISFHLEDGVAKWKFVIQRRVAVEREFKKDVVDVKEVMDLIKVDGLLKTVVGFSQCYEGLVKEFIVNIPEDISDKNSKEFRKVKNEGAGELEVTDNQVCREITAKQVKVWSFKKHLPVGKLTIKYAILHKIGAAIWVPRNHISTIANTLGRRKPALSVHYKLFEGSHVEDIVMTSAMKRPASKVGAIAELKETCKELGEGIRVATTRKQSLEALIESLEQAEGENVEHANVSHEEEAEAHTSSERSTNNDDASGNSDSGAVEEAANSSSNE